MSWPRRGARWAPTVVVLVAAVLGAAGPARADTGLFESSTGIFSDAVENGGPSNVVYCGGPGQVACGALGVAGPGAQVRWGSDATHNAQSGLAYDPRAGAVSTNQAFVLGTLTHFNNVVNNPVVTNVDLHVQATV